MRQEELDAIERRWEAGKEEGVFLSAFTDFPVLLAEVKRLSAELEHLTRERDVTINDLKKIAKEIREKRSENIV